MQALLYISIIIRITMLFLWLLIHSWWNKKLFLYCQYRHCSIIAADKSFLLYCNHQTKKYINDRVYQYSERKNQSYRLNLLVYALAENQHIFNELMRPVFAIRGNLLCSIFNFFNNLVSFTPIAKVHMGPVGSLRWVNNKLSPIYKTHFFCQCINR